MKLQNLSLGLGLIATGAIAFVGTPAQAFNFTNGTSMGSCGALTDDFSGKLSTTTLNTCKTGDGFTLNVTQPTDSYLQGKKVGGVTGIGISGPTDDIVSGEINKGEALTATLDVARVIKSIDLSFLYQPGVFADRVFEVAGITANGAVSGTLSVTGDSSATWDLDGTVINIDPSTKGDGGWYRILNPFGDAFVSSLSFTAITQDGADADHYSNSDYSLVGIQAQGVPEPATILGLGAIGGLMAASRRKKSA